MHVFNENFEYFFLQNILVYNVSVTNIFLVTTILNVDHSSDIIDSMRIIRPD